MVGAGRDLCGSSSPAPAEAGSPTASNLALFMGFLSRVRSEKIILIGSLPGGVSGLAARVGAGVDPHSRVAALELPGWSGLHTTRQQLLDLFGFSSRETGGFP